MVDALQLGERSCLPRRQLAEVCLMAGDMRDSLGLRGDAHNLWSQALMLAEQECQALGLKERQVEGPVNHCHTFAHHTCFPPQPASCHHA